MTTSFERRWRPVGRPVAFGLGGLLVGLVVALALGPRAGPPLTAATSPALSPGTTGDPFASTFAPTIGPTRLPWVPNSECLVEPPVVQVLFTGPVRADAEEMPTICSPGYTDEMTFVPDANDATYGAVDITGLTGGTASWFMTLRGTPPPTSPYLPEGTVYEHGVVIDVTWRGRGEYLVVIDNDVQTPGDLRTWVTELESGLTDIHIGPPYGIPFDFIHPGEGKPDPARTPVPDRASAIWMFFLGAQPWLHAQEPEATPGGRPIRFYAYALLRTKTEVIAWDYAPDWGWIVSWPNL